MQPPPEGAPAAAVPLLPQPAAQLGLRHGHQERDGPGHPHPPGHGRRRRRRGLARHHAARTEPHADDHTGITLSS